MGVKSRVAVTPSQYALAVTSSAIVRLSPPLNANTAEIYVRTAPVVFTRDGEDPTATKGIQANVGDIILLTSRSEVELFEVIAVSTTAALDTAYFTDISG